MSSNWDPPRSAGEAPKPMAYSRLETDDELIARVSATVGHVVGVPDVTVPGRYNATPRAGCTGCMHGHFSETAERIADHHGYQRRIVWQA